MRHQPSNRARQAAGRRLSEVNRQTELVGRTAKIKKNGPSQPPASDPKLSFDEPN
jgi:hypothetical protein